MIIPDSSLSFFGEYSAPPLARRELQQAQFKLWTLNFKLLWDTAYYCLRKNRIWKVESWRTRREAMSKDEWPRKNTARQAATKKKKFGQDEQDSQDKIFLLCDFRILSILLILSEILSRKQNNWYNLLFLCSLRSLVAKVLSGKPAGQTHASRWFPW